MYPAARQSAFTLTELLVAIALLLVIMVGVSTIFRTAGQTIGMGIALTDQNRALAATGQQLQQDIIGYSDTDPFVQGSGLYPVNESDPASAPPFLFIRNATQAAPHDKDAASTDFRVDSLGFFARGAFKRQTGSNQLVDQMPVFTKAYVWYGHLRLGDPSDPANTGKRMNPGAGSAASNPYNFYANQWILGRRAILLTDVTLDASATLDASSPRGKVFDYNGNPVLFYGRDDDVATRNNNTNFAPLGKNAQATPRDTGTFVTTEQVTESRYDVAAVNRHQSWGDYAALIQGYQSDWETAGRNATTNWVDGTLSAGHFAVRPHAWPTEGIDLDWTAGTIGANQASFANAAALSVPILLRNCTNFTVEFAGDYVDQKAGAPNPAPLFDVNNPSTWSLDGVIDYDIVGGRQQIHWYGLGDAVASDRTVTAMRGTAMPFELAPPTAVNRVYSCGWTKDMLCLPGTTAMPRPMSLAPKLIRITVEVTDPQGRVLEDMTRQFVFPVKYN